MKKRRSRIASIMQERQPKITYPVTIDRVNYWLKIINKEIFKGKLDSFDDIRIKRLHRKWAWCVGKYDEDDGPYCDLILNNHMKSERHLVDVLVHETVHRAQWLFEDKMDHGKSFFKYKKPLKKFGIVLTI